MPVEDLAAFRNMIERTGGSGAEAEGALRGLSAAIQDLLTTGNIAILPGLNAIGGAVTDPLMELIRKFAAFAERTNAADPIHGPARVSQIGALLNIPQGVIDRLNKGVAGLDAGLAESKRLDAMVPGMTGRATALQEAWGGMREAADSFGHVLLDDLTPVLITILDWIKEGIVWVRDFAIAHHGWATAITFVATAFLGLEAAMKAFGLLRLILGGGSLITALFGGGIGALGIITAGVTSLTGALSALLVPLAALAAWYAALHISSGAGDAEIAAERQHTADRARDNPDAVIPSTPRADPARAWYRRNIPQWMRHRDDAPSPAPSGNTLQAAMGISDAQYEAFRQGVAGIERARYDQMGGSSNRFAGRYQMGAAEIAETARRLGEAVPSQAQFLNDPAMQERFFAAYTAGHHASLMARSARYRAMSPSQQLSVLGYAHNQGPGGASRWLDTGQEGRDANGTSGAAYSVAVQRNLGRPQAMAQNDNSSETHIGSITIHTQATDARGIAATIDPAIRRRQGFVTQANSGLS
jgi:hypothetical protein